MDAIPYFGSLYQVFVKMCVFYVFLIFCLFLGVCGVLRNLEFSINFLDVDRDL